MENQPSPEHLHHEIHHTMHQAEHPLFRVCAVLSVLMAVFVLFFATPIHEFIEGHGKVPYAELLEMEESVFEEIIELDEKLFSDVSGTQAAELAAFIVGLLFLLCLAAYVLVTLYSAYVKVHGRAVRVTEKNFPDLYARSREYAQMLGMKKTPEVYIVQQNGLLGALSGWIIGKNYIVLNAELVDVAYMEQHDPDPVYFAMAAEFGHIWLYHTRLWYKLLVMSGHVLIPLGAALERSEVYSCDRIAQLLTNDTASAESVALLSVGRHLYRYVDPDDYIQSIGRNARFPERIGLFIYNALSKTPVIPYRMQAILDKEKKSGRLF